MRTSYALLRSLTVLVRDLGNGELEITADMPPRVNVTFGGNMINLHTAAIAAAISATEAVAQLRFLLAEATRQAEKADRDATQAARRAFQALSGRWDERVQVWMTKARPTQEELRFFLRVNLGGHTRDGMEVSVEARLHVLDSWQNGQPPVGARRHHTALAAWSHEVERRD